MRPAFVEQNVRFSRFHVKGGLPRVRVARSVRGVRASKPSTTEVKREMSTEPPAVGRSINGRGVRICCTRRISGHGTLLAELAWPSADPALIVDDEVTIAVQVNGKLRATLALPRDISSEDAERAALADLHVQRALAGKPPRKVIVVPNRIVNVVV